MNIQGLKKDSSGMRSGGVEWSGLCDKKAKESKLCGGKRKWRKKKAESY